jgi:hypothetical protein
MAEHNRPHLNVMDVIENQLGNSGGKIYSSIFLRILMRTSSSRIFTRSCK